MDVMGRPEDIKYVCYRVQHNLWAVRTAAAMRLKELYGRTLFIPKAAKRFITDGKNVSPQTRHNDFEHRRGETLRIHSPFQQAEGELALGDAWK